MLGLDRESYGQLKPRYRSARRVEAIRRRPALYVGALDDPQLPGRLIVQGLCHALDRVADHKCTRVSVEVLGPRKARIEYDAGMPLAEKDGYQGRPAADVLLRVLYACRNARSSPDVAKNACSLGLPVLNALSKSLIATTTSGGRTCRLAYRGGNLVEPIAYEAVAGPGWTRIEVTLDTQILGEKAPLSRNAIERELHALYTGAPCLLGAVEVNERHSD